MKPEAIFIAAAELITQIESTSQPANEVINAYTRARRYIGSKDRRQLTDMVWHYLRYRARLLFLYPNATIADRLQALTDVPNSIPNAPNDVNWEVPAWLIPLVPEAEKEIPALLETPSIILRANGDREAIRKRLLNEGIETEPTQHSPYGLVLTKRTNLAASDTFRKGLVEIQDEGSQLVALATGIRPDEKVLDYCAGAGGKSLIFAQMMQGKGSIVAHDVSARSLAELQKRADRAGVRCIQVQRPVTDTDFDHVVADVPCSGTGTWRRCPDARWKLTWEQLSRLVVTQGQILDTMAPLVRPGGKLSYMTCSITRSENEEQVESFVARHPEFKVISMQRFSPFRTGTDGLFVCILQKRSQF